MGDVVAGMLEVTQATDLALGIGAGLDDLEEQPGGFERVSGGIVEVREELLVPRQESRQNHRKHSPRVRIRSADARPVG